MPEQAKPFATVTPRKAGTGPVSLPAALVYGTVSWAAVGLAEDTKSDIDSYPDAKQINGWATFTAEPKKVVKFGEEAVTVLPLPLRYQILTGRLIDKEGRTEISLVGNDSPGTTPQGWSYHVDWELDDGITFGSFDFKLAGGEHKDLSNEQPLETPSPGVIITKGEPGERGEDGEAATISVGQVQTVSPLTPAAVRNVGTTSAAIFDIDIPQGMPGSGSIDSVNGDPGPDVLLDQDDIPDSATRVAMTPAERSKLQGVATGATANATDAQLRSRATHTGTQNAATISDLREAVEDYVAALLASGTNVTLQYIDNGENAGSLQISSQNTTDPEAVRDAIGIALVGAGLISVAVNDAGDTITISTTATANSTDAQLRDRSTHTGTQVVNTLSDATATGKSVLTAADAAAARTAIGAAAAASVEGIKVHDGTAGGGVRPTGYSRVRWVGGLARPTNMVAGDVWEHDA